MESYTCPGCKFVIYSAYYSFCPNCLTAIAVETKQTRPDSEQEISYKGKIDCLIEKAEKMFKKHTEIKLKIISKKQTMEGLIDIPSNNSGEILIKANDKQIKIKETAFRILIQKDIDNLFKELKYDVMILEEFNNKFETRIEK